MAVSFDEWRAAKREGKQAVEKPDFAAWRQMRNSKKEEEDKRTVAGAAGGRIGVPAAIGADDVAATPNRFATPQAVTLGDAEVPATGTIGAIAGMATGIGNLGESVPASYREGRRTQQASVARQELDFDGRVTLEPARPAKYERGGVLVSPATPGKYLAGKEAEDYVARLEAPTADTQTMQEYSDEATVFGRAATSALSQPEQALSILGGIAGGAVGMPGVGAAVGSLPAITAAYNAEYLRNRQAGLSKEESRANALAKLPIEALTEFVGGRFGAKGIPAGAVLGGAEEGAAQAGGMLVDLASRELSSTPEAYEQKIPDTLPQALGEIGESALGGVFGATAMHSAVAAPAAALRAAPRLPGKMAEGLAKAREALAKAGGISGGTPETKAPAAEREVDWDSPSGTIEIPKDAFDAMGELGQARLLRNAKVVSDDGNTVTLTTYSTKTSNKDERSKDSSIDLGVEVSNKPVNIESSIKDSVKPADDLASRKIPPAGDTASSATLSPVQETTETREVLVNRAAALREASQQNRLDEGTVKRLVNDDEELRLTLQEDEKRRASGVLPTPERPFLSDDERNLISQRRSEIREDLEKHRAAVGYGNALRDLEARIAKEFPVTPDAPAATTQQAPSSLSMDDAVRMARAEAEAKAETDPTFSNWSVKNPSAYGTYLRARAREIITEGATAAQNQSQTPPATTPQATATEAPVAPAVSVHASAAATPPVASAPVEQNLVTSTQVTSVSTTPAKAPKKTPAPKVLSDKEAMTQATVELQSKALSDPTYQAFVQKNPAAFGKQIRERANQLKAESQAKAQTQTQAPPAVAPVAPTASTPETPSLDAPATPGAVNISDKAEQARDNLLRQATTAKEALETVASDAFAASPAMRTIANKLLGSGDLNDVKAEVADTPEQVAKLSRKDGTTAGGRFTTVDNTMRVLPNEGGRVTQAAEVVIHEASHAATAAVVEGVRAGRIKDPELVGDVEDAELARQAVAKAIADGTLVDDTGRADNAARNVDELLATVFSSPTLRTKLDTVRVTIPRRGPRRGRIATALQVIKDLVFKALKPLGITRQEVDQILVTEAVDKIVTRFAKEKSARDVMVGQQKGTSANMPNDIKQDFGVETPTERGYVRGTRNVINGVRELLTPRGEASFDAQRMGERAIGVANEMRLAADVVARDANVQLNELTKDLPPRQKTLYRYNMAEYLAGNPDVDVPKDLKVSLDAMREILDNGTLRLIALGAVKPADIPKMLNNLGKWTHRDYEVFHYKPGTATRDGEYKKKVQSEALEGKDVVADVLPDVMEDLKLPTPEVITRIGEMIGKKGGKKEWRSESGKLLREVQGKPEPKKERKTSNAKIRAAAETYLRDMAAMWGIGRTTKLEGDDGIIARLAALSEGGTDKLRAAARRYANSLLDPEARPGDDAPYSGKANPLSIDDSALDKERKNIPEWQRVLWGKFRDPITQFAASVEAQANVISKFTALEEYKQRGLKSGRVKENKAGMTDANMRPKGYVLLENADDTLYYGPLQGMWVKVEDLEYLSLAGSMGFAEKLIRDSMGKSFGIPILTFFGQPAKMALIGADHTAQIVQYLSSVLLFSGSLLTPSTFAKASKGAKYTSFGGTFLGGAIKDETLDSDVKAWIKQGVLVNNALAGDARRKLSDLAAQPGEIFLPAPTRAKLGIQRTYGKAMDSLSRILSFGDETGKIMMAYARMEYLKDIHPEMSRDELRELAGEQTLMTTPSYNREAPVARMMGNSGFINVFAPFWAAMIRNTYNHLAIATEYGKMPGAKAKKYAALELGQLGLKSVAASAYLTFLGAAAQGLVGMMGDDEEENKAKKAAELQQKQPDAVRALVSDYQLGNVELIREAGSDKYTYVAVQRFDPMPFGAIMSANERGDEQEIAEIIRSYLFSEAPVLRAVLETAAVTPTVLGNMALGDKSPLSAQEIKDTQKAIEGLKELTASFVPSGIKRVYKQATDDVDFNGLETVLANTGHTVGTLDLVKVAGQTAADYKGIIDARQSGMTADVNTDNLLGASADWTDNLVERAEAWTQARKKIEALQKLGKSDMWIRDAIKQNPYAESLSKQEVDSLLNGQFYVPDYRKWLNARHEAALKKAGTNQTKIKEVNDAFKQMHEDLQKQASGFTKALRTKGVIR